MLRLPPVFILLGLSLVTLVLYFHHSMTTRIAALSRNPDFKPANETLGFGGIFVVSGPGSTRRDALIQAANVSELHLTIPELPTWSWEQMQYFKGPENPAAITNGSIRAWMSHHAILEDFLDSGLETALIMEDDVDWDVRLRTTQLPMAAAGARSLLPPADERHYWGHPDDWELIYVGHCGDYFTTLDEDVGVGVVHPNNLTQIAHTLYTDETMPDRMDLHPYTASLLTAFGLPERTRMVHRSVEPLCTFGYAVTRASAKRIMAEIAPRSSTTATTDTAYDVAILAACRDKGMRCFTVNPELFHHMEGASLIDGQDRKVDRPPVDKAGAKQVFWRKETSNINCGFWSKHFRFDGDMSKLAYLREEVGRKGQCLKPGRTPNGDISIGMEPR